MLTFKVRERPGVLEEKAIHGGMQERGTAGAMSRGRPGVLEKKAVDGGM